MKKRRLKKNIKKTMLLLIFISVITLLIIIHNSFINKSIKQCKKLHNQAYCNKVIKDLKK